MKIWYTAKKPNMKNKLFPPHFPPLIMFSFALGIFMILFGIYACVYGLPGKKPIAPKKASMKAVPTSIPNGIMIIPGGVIEDPPGTYHFQDSWGNWHETDNLNHFIQVSVPVDSITGL